MKNLRKPLIWAALLALMFIPVVIAIFSPLLQWRQPVYIIAGFAGVLGLSFLLIQPLFAADLLPGLKRRQSRRCHKWLGIILLASVIVHVAGLWITSPPDVIDVLLFRSPTPFSVWGAIAMWCVFATAAIALLHRSYTLRPRTWQQLHVLLSMLVIIGTVVHAIQIDGAMGTVSKAMLCVFVVISSILAILKLRIFKLPHERR
jgi:predicted ferric reductase